MNQNPLSELIALMPKIVAWIEEQSAVIKLTGTPLSQWEVGIALAMGVNQGSSQKTENKAR